MVRVGLEMPSWRMMMAPGARFFVTSQRMYQAGGAHGVVRVGGTEDAFVAVGFREAELAGAGYAAGWAEELWC